MIFSIQSNVMHGYVGNRASLPFYHACGLETSHLDTVRLAAHPGYGTNAKDVMPAEAMSALFHDYLALSDTTPFTAFHTGYFGTAAQVKASADFISALLVRNPDMIVLVDPVFGDKGREYVAPDVITAIIERLLPLADIITPNQFELSYLANTPIGNVTHAKSALPTIITKPNQIAIATGINGDANIHDTNIHDICLENDQMHDISAPLLESGVSGAGDAFASLILSQIVSGKTTPQALKIASHITHHMVRQSKSPLTMNIASGLSAYQSMSRKG